MEVHRSRKQMGQDLKTAQEYYEETLQKLASINERMKRAVQNSNRAPQNSYYSNKVKMYLVRAEVFQGFLENARRNIVNIRRRVRRLLQKKPNRASSPNTLPIVMPAVARRTRRKKS